MGCKIFRAGHFVGNSDQNSCIKVTSQNSELLENASTECILKTGGWEKKADKTSQEIGKQKRMCVRSELVARLGIQLLCFRSD